MSDEHHPEHHSPGDNSRHFPHTVRLLQRREGRRESESPQRAHSSDDDAELLRMSGGGGGEKLASTARDDASLRERLRDKMQQAAARRESLQAERRRQLEELERQRQAKLRQTREMRRKAVARFIEEAPQLLVQFDNAGLHVRPGHPLSVEVVEQTLVADPVVCEHCAGSPALFQRMCPATQRPHRRALVLAAERLLKLIGDTRVNLVPPKAEVSDTTIATPRTKAKRGISVNPQLFVLSFFNAAMPDGDPEADPLLCDCARHLLEVVEGLKAALGTPEALAAADEAYVVRLLQAFAKAWRQYAKVADPLINESTAVATRDDAQRELVQATIDAVVGAQRRLRELGEKGDVADGGEADLLSKYIAVLEERCARIGGSQAVAALQAAVAAANTPAPAVAAPPAADPSPSALGSQQQQQQQQLRSPATSPEHRPSRGTPGIVPPAPLPDAAYRAASMGGTSGSDTDGSATGASSSLRIYGPPLPPNWRVDEHGVSVPPPPPSPTELAAERWARLEYKAQQAYKARVRPREYSSPTSRDIAAARAVLTDAMWQQFRLELSATPPNLDRVPKLFGAVTDALVEALPKKLRGRASQELRDVLDWSVVRHRVRAGHGEAACGELTRYVVGKVVELGAPARAEALRTRLEAVLRRANDGEPTATVVVDMFRLMFDAIEQLRRDIAEFSMVAISDELAERCVEFQREFIEGCLPPPAEWASTIRFLRAGVDAFRAQPTGALPLVDDSELKTALFMGAVELLKSSQRPAESRWSLFAKEALHFDKATIFDCANTVQLCTLRLMLSGTVSLVLHPLRLQAAEATALLRAMDAKVVGEWLAPQSNFTLDALKSAVVEEIHFLLNNSTDTRQSPSRAAAAAPAPVRSLSATDIGVLHGVIEKMTDTTSMQYSTFEQRVTAAIAQHLFLSALGRDTAGVRQLGMINDEVVRCARDLRIALQHNWTVYQPYYVQIADAVLAPQQQQQQQI